MAERIFIDGAQSNAVLQQLENDINAILAKVQDDVKAKQDQIDALTARVVALEAA